MSKNDPRIPPARIFEFSQVEKFERPFASSIAQSPLFLSCGPGLVFWFVSSFNIGLFGAMSSFHEDNKENVRGLDVLSVAEAKIEVIRETHDYYFAKDKQSTLKKLVTEVDHLLEDIPVEAWENCTELTGRYWCLRGIAWNYLSATSDAEKYLEKAVEVSEGKKAEPLCHLAQCLWKRGDLSLAIELYKRSLEAG